MQFEPLQKTRIFEEIVNQIQLQIKQGIIKHGDKLPSERDLAKTLKVSRTSVREALRTLEIMGYAEIKPGEGVFIKEVTLDEVIHKLVTSVKVDTNLICDSLEVRDLIEVEIAARAALNRTEEDLQVILSAIKDMENDIAAGGTGLEGDEEFHLAVSHATHNQVYEIIIHVLVDFLTQSRKATLQIPGVAQTTLNDHREIYNAIKEHDPEKASKLMRKHIENAKKFMMQIKDEFSDGDLL